jgi:nucleotide-binding universal stress UspA family protein
VTDNAGGARTTPVHVLVAIDGSRAGADAVARAVGLLGADRRVTLLRVLTHVPEEALDEDDEPLYTPEQLGHQWNAQVRDAESDLAAVAALLGGGSVDQRVEAGDVARTVCTVARELDVDAIVVGCHARSRLKRTLLGSVSRHVLQDAACPVIVVPEARQG